MRVRIAKTAGFCFGVARAVDMAQALAAEGKRVATLGPIINNRTVTEALERKGIRSVRSIDELEDGEVAVIRSHGVPAEVYAQLGDKEYIDTTCPCVARIHEIVVAECAEGRTVIIIGDRDHAEIHAIASRCDNALIFGIADELYSYICANESLHSAPLSVVAQTTQDISEWEKSIEILKKECTNIKTFDTICIATSRRQHEAAEMAAECDLMIVVGDRTSANTRRLYEICAARCADTVWIEKADELSVGGNYKDVCITAGASTPMWIIEEVYEMFDEMNNNVAGTEPEAVDTVEAVNAAEAVVEIAAEPTAPVEAIPAETPDIQSLASSDGDSFAELLEQSLKTLTSGEKIVGLVTSINGTEVQVDLGTKHAGYIPLSELTDDPNASPEDIVTVGQEIECYVVRVNDAEGTAMLSKKRLDSLKGWEEVEAAVESGDSLEGIVTEENKGGIVVTVKGVRVFVPASRTGIPRDGDLSSLLKSKVHVKITEVNRARRRVVGSIRDAGREQRKAQAESIWATLEVGNRYDGVVKSILTYGSFVDVGGIDGMVHISEMSWSRVRHPQDIMSVGDKVNVRIIALDREKRKISLSMREDSENPWKKFTAAHESGEVVRVKVVKLMPFGAFAEIIPGVDGLIHISQLADHRINKPGDVLSEGQEVDVKITSIDYDRQKVWLSIRALIEPTVVEPAEGEDEYTTDTVIAVSEEGCLEIPAEQKEAVAIEEALAETVAEEPASTEE